MQAQEIVQAVVREASESPPVPMSSSVPLGAQVQAGVAKVVADYADTVAQAMKHDDVRVRHSHLNGRHGTDIHAPAPVASLDDTVDAFASNMDPRMQLTKGPSLDESHLAAIRERLPQIFRIDHTSGEQIRQLLDTGEISTEQVLEMVHRHVLNDARHS